MVSGGTVQFGFLSLCSQLTVGLLEDQVHQGTPLSRVSQRAAVPGFWRSLIPDFSGVPALRAWVPPSSTPCKSHVPLGATERDTAQRADRRASKGR